MSTAIASSRNIGFPMHVLKQTLSFCRSQPLGAICFGVILVILLAGIFAEVIAPYDPVAVNTANLLQPPSLAHIAGTDAFGRDIFSRLVYGARSAMLVGLIASTMGCVIGSLIGTASAYYGGLFDTVVQRLLDILMAFPIIVLAIVIVAVLGRAPFAGIDLNLIAAITVPIIPKVARVVRSAAITVRNQPYVDAAKTAGFSDTRIILRHMMPNLMAPFLILFTAYVAQSILLEASLSFLGLGVTEPTPAWGLMLSGRSFDLFHEAPWLIIAPGLAISLAVFSFSLFGDALRDWLDPRFKT